MKIATHLLATLALCTYAPLVNAAEDDKHADHDDHEKIIAGPNGGRVITSVEPHLEFFVNKDRTVTITALDDNNKATKITGQKVKLTAGKRLAPTRLKFIEKDGVLVSDGKLPEGNDFPVVVQIRTAEGAKKVNAKFNLNLTSTSPTARPAITKNTPAPATTATTKATTTKKPPRS